MLPRSAYLHCPFCRHRCGYCNFAVVAGRDDLAPDYLAALEKELEKLGSPRAVETLYLGGGTPTHLPHDLLRRLLDLAKAWFPPIDGRSHLEWTVEANPGDLSAEKIGLLRLAGVTRISLGGQSFHEEKLRLLERDHSAEQVEQTVQLAKQAGLQVNLDLIFATPGETLDQWRDDLDHAIRLGPDHISTYGLTFEKGTSFWTRRRQGGLMEAEEETQRQMYEMAIDRLSAAGFEHYEVSNFARAGCRSRHNEAYWSGREWYAAGPGAARYVDGVRETNHRSTTTWLRRLNHGESPVAEREELTPEQRARETLVFGLRKLEGVDENAFLTETGYRITDLAQREISRFEELGLLEKESGCLRLTREGLLISDAIWPELL